MSAPSSVPCAEPMPYSDDISGYANIDFNVAPSAMQTLQPSIVPVDSILSKQLGPVTNPVQNVSGVSQVPGSPILPPVGESNAKPLLSSYAGADISSPMTLSTSMPSNVSVNDITSTQTIAEVQKPVTVVQNTNAPSSALMGPQAFTNVANVTNAPRRPSIINKENFNNVQKNKNLANFVDNRNKVEHFQPPRRVEHFSQMTMMDNIVVAIVIGAFVYYVVTLKYGDNQVDTSKIPIVSQLTDNQVSMENKIIIVVAVVIACVLISRMMK